MTVVLVNPRAGSLRRQRALARQLAAQRARDPELRVHTTAGPGDARRLARLEVEGGCRSLLVVGGDGTLGEVVSGIVDAGAPPGAVTLGVVHAGTGGDLRRALAPEATANIEGALACTRPRPVDLILAEWQGPEGPARAAALNEASVGLSVRVCSRVNRAPRRLGALGFFTASLAELARYSPTQLRIAVEGMAPRLDASGPPTDGPSGGQLVEVATLVVANGPFAGGGMRFAPEARLDDGLLDVVLLEAASRSALLGLTGRLYRGTLLSSPRVRVLRGRRVTLAPVEAPARVLAGAPVGGPGDAAVGAPGDAPVGAPGAGGAEPPWFELDGDPRGPLPVTLSVLPGHLLLRGA